ncbi:unnamed protein product [Ectocarpus sp. CCAP 1310/34]|nr:unnamed protein product [Ectocarpus sp. CCAP 1310/34]
MRLLEPKKLLEVEASDSVEDVVHRGQSHDLHAFIIPLIADSTSFKARHSLGS